MEKQEMGKLEMEFGKNMQAKKMHQSLVLAGLLV